MTKLQWQTLYIAGTTKRQAFIYFWIVYNSSATKWKAAKSFQNFLEDKLQWKTEEQAEKISQKYLEDSGYFWEAS
jgi:hypothetical protein